MKGQCDAEEDSYTAMLSRRWMDRVAEEGR